MIEFGNVAMAQGTLQTGFLFGIGVGQAMIGICPKGRVREALTWATLLLTLGCLALHTLPVGQFLEG